MNKPTQISLANSLTVNQPAVGATQQTIISGEQTLSARNIVFAKGSVQIDILVDKHWQTLRLATTQSPEQAQKISSAQVQLSADGKQLTILPTQLNIPLTQHKQLQSLLNFINTGSQLDNKPFPVNVITAPIAKLLISQLHASLPLNKEVAQLLQAEQPLQALINVQDKNFRLTVINRFADNLHQQPISQGKLATWLASLVPLAQLKTVNKSVQLTIPQQKNAFNIPVKTEHVHQLSNTMQKVTLAAVNEQLQIKTHVPSVDLVLKNSLTHTFNSLLSAQHLAKTTALSQANTVTSSPSLSSNSPISSWLQHSFADLKTRIKDAVQYFENKPFTKPSPSFNKDEMSRPPSPRTIKKMELATLLPESLRRINLTALANNNLDPLQADISKGSSLPKHFHSSPPLVQFFQQVKAALNTLTTPIQPAVANTQHAATELPLNKLDSLKTVNTQMPTSSTSNRQTAETGLFLTQTTSNSQTKMGQANTGKGSQITPTEKIQTPVLKEPSIPSSIKDDATVRIPKSVPMNEPLITNSAQSRDKSKIKTPINELVQKPLPIDENKNKSTQTSSHYGTVKNVEVVESNKVTLKPAHAPIHSSIDSMKQSLTANIKTKPQMHNPSIPTLKAPLTVSPIASQLSLPIEAKLLAPLLNMPIEKTPPYTLSHISHSEKNLLSRQILSAKIEQLAQPKFSDNVDLNRLVNQAFSRMIDSQSHQPLTIQREILSIIQPQSLPASALHTSFSQAIEHLTVSILAAPALNTISALTFNGQNSVDALLQVLVPNFKAVNSQKLQEQLLQANSQVLAADLSQIKTALNQVTTTPINQQPDTNPLVQFLLPMRLPPEAAQTEISLGQYKKPSKDKLEAKSVWFVRLNFDYATLGQLQITAELMDKALDCKLLASSQEITAMAHPHIESLRHKLTAHGLQVGELNLSQGAPQHQAFYQSHAIINIKV
ncbi:flagellar hook-length control protein FliK [Pseudoalteromonas sp. NEC-BIFX-2020_015]|uniref:flagellar hook-length control protein FliK n=1 Tax=Pseudoalteromonas sp. NEC-BIFX-2020_015 TaxID=2729544 RepID=UPI0020116E9F|nr:flagellar hook-length control protein FliK [Pseudoalteromonas sp. NEC-BIFX-2020_015]